MRTTIEIDDQLMKDALRVTGAKTKREAVEIGLRTVLRLRQQEELRRFKGKLPWEDNLAAMQTAGPSPSLKQLLLSETGPTELEVPTRR
jgi:Arc/MetJ family transcription regulator